VRVCGRQNWRMLYVVISSEMGWFGEGGGKQSTRLNKNQTNPMTLPEQPIQPSTQPPSHSPTSSPHPNSPQQTHHMAPAPTYRRATAPTDSLARTPSLFPYPCSRPWLEQGTSIMTISVQPASRAARRNLVDLLLLDISGIEIHPGSI
jgi:hypothetical protein